MEIVYKRNIKQSFMVLSSEEIVADYQIQMCTRNKIAGLLEMETVVADGRLQFWFDITGKQSLEEYVKNHPMEESLFVRLLGAVQDVATNLNGYLLEENHIQLEMQTIYIDLTTQQLYFCYFPKEQRALTESFHLLMEYLLTRIEHSDKQVVTIAYEAYQMTLLEGYNIEKIYQMAMQKGEKNDSLLEGENEYALAANQVDSPQENRKENVTENLPNQLEKVKEQIKNIVSSIDKKTFSWKIRKNKSEQLQMVFEPEEDICREESSYTVFLGEQAEQMEYTGVLEYVGVETKPNMIIHKSPYHIGNRDDADGIIDKKSISRLHARITREQDDYFIEDLNSRNGTWVNGELLNYLDKVHLFEGSKITFAREEYHFHIK
jgi:hypothetical protein